KIKTKVQEVWQKIQNGEYTDQALAWAFDVESVQAFIVGDVLKRQGLQRDPVDQASNALTPLLRAFKENMVMVGTIAAGIGLAGTLLAFVPAFTAYATLGTAVLYG